MPYVSQNDILAYIASVDNFTQGTTKTFTITLFKDFINNQLDASQIDSISVVLYDSIQLKKFEYLVEMKKNKMIFGKESIIIKLNFILEMFVIYHLLTMLSMV